MVNAAPIVSQPIPQPIGEKRLVFHSIDWPRFVTLREALSHDRNVRFTYSQGKLEVTMPLELHEFSARLIERFILILVFELGMDIKTMGSTRLDKAALDRSAEPDNAYYIQNRPLVTGRDVDLAKDPPPDLVVEIDITHTDIDKLTLYAEMGIPEFWRYDGKLWQILRLQGQAYTEVTESPIFKGVPKAKLYEFLAIARQSEMKAERMLRDWMQTSR